MTVSDERETLRPRGCGASGATAARVRPGAGRFPAPRAAAHSRRRQRRSSRHAPLRYGSVPSRRERTPWWSAPPGRYTRNHAPRRRRCRDWGTPPPPPRARTAAMQSAIEPHRRRIPDAFDRDLQRRHQRRCAQAARASPLPSRATTVVVRMPQIDGEKHRSRHDIAAVRPAFEQPHRRHRIRRVVPADLVDRGDHAARRRAARRAATASASRRHGLPCRSPSPRTSACPARRSPRRWSSPPPPGSAPARYAARNARRACASRTAHRLCSRSASVPRRTVCPRDPRARRHSAVSNTPANTPDDSIAGAKREPSSLVQSITSIGALVS